MKNIVKKPELLSPAGNMACLEAALSAGCDAVYAGADRFGARAYAGNFTSDEFMQAIDRMHLFGKKVYLTLNTLIKPDEFRQLHDFVRPFYEAGLDGVIVQDIGVIAMLLADFPGMEVHASTQMSISSVFGARLLKEMGVSRIVPSRELSLDEIRDIITETGIETECFIHGAMCYSYSGLCLMSSFLGGRSGNRGRCAGPCRQPYSAGRMNGKYLLSMKDMCTIDILDELIRAGIASFKIEGRMKSPEYVYGVTEIYRRAIDKITTDPDKRYVSDSADRDRLVELYSRGGISGGYYHRHNGLALITVEKGSYKREDTARYESEKPGIALTARFIAFAECETELILKPAEKEDDSCAVSVKGDMAERADKRPMSEPDFRKQLMKTGDSDFYFEKIDIETDGASFVRIASVNELRRRALDMMKEKLLHGYKRSM